MTAAAADLNAMRMRNARDAAAAAGFEVSEAEPSGLL